MTDRAFQIRILAAREIGENRRTHLVFVVTAFMLGAGLVALVVAALALRAEVTTYTTSRDLLLALGKPLDALAAPAFQPLKLLRGFIEYVEIIGAILGIVLGHRAGVAERGRNTLALLLTRPLSKTTFLAGKCLGNLVVILFVLALTFVLGAAGIVLIGGVGLTGDDVLRIWLTFAAAALYVAAFFALGFLLALRLRHSAHALLLAFAVWLAFVLVAPQIGDTLDPDNQVAGGVFRKLGIAKPQEKEIMQSFTTYETVRDAIEQASPAKHFERWSFALLGIKESYAGQSVGIVARDRAGDAWWLLGMLTVFVGMLFFRPLDIAKLTGE